MSWTNQTKNTTNYNNETKHTTTYAKGSYLLWAEPDNHLIIKDGGISRIAITLGGYQTKYKPSWTNQTKN